MRLLCGTAAVGAAVGYRLIQLTRGTRTTPPPGGYDAAASTEALKAVRITGWENRVTRVALASVFAVAAWSFAQRSAHGRLLAPAEDDQGAAGTAKGAALTAAGHALSWLGVASLVLEAVVWGSSGVHGQ